MKQGAAIMFAHGLNVHFNLLEPRFRPLTVLANRRRMLDAWYKSRLYTRTGLTPDEVEARILRECQNGGDFLRIVMEAMCRKQGVERWAETTPDHCVRAPAC